MKLNLNDRQKEAVKHRNGPLLIIAGAGTGKTSVITQRIIDLIESKDAKPSEILALTFTEKAAGEMIERVDLAMPIGHEEVHISTFHSFCDSVLRKDCVHLGIDSNYSLMTEAQAYVFFRRNLFDLPLDTLRPLGNPTSNIGNILRHFSRLQDEEVFPEEYHALVKQLAKEKGKDDDEVKMYDELAKTYEAYTKLKIRDSKMDFGDLILLTIRLFRERPSVLNKYHNRFKYILVDEFQDTNYTQNVLVNLLALNGDPKDVPASTKKKANITVVGDDDQAIYKFRGAAISNILHFKEIYPSAKKVVLIENYRSHQKILDSAYTLIQHNNPDRLEETESIDKRLLSKVVDEDSTSDPINHLIGDTAIEEAELIAKEIIKLTGNIEKLKADNSIVLKKYDSIGQAMFMDIEKGNGKIYDFSDIAILVRAHSHTEEIIKIMRNLGIPYKFGGARGLYKRPEVQDLIAYIRVLADYKDDLSMFKILNHEIWGLTKRELMELFRLARSKKISVFELLEEFWNIKVGESELEEETGSPSNIAKKILSESSLESLWKLILLFDSSYAMIKDEAFVTRILFDYFKGSGYMDSLLLNEQSDAETAFKVQNIGKYFELIQAFEKDNPGTTVFEYVNYLDYSIEIGETPSIDADSLDEFNAVNIMTAHGAKGLEFPVVFVANLVSERFPTRNRGDSFEIPDALVKDIIPDTDKSTENLREERRLFYVATTRAKERLYLTAARFYGDTKRKKKLSIFFDEFMGKKMSEVFEKTGAESQSDINLATLRSLEQAENNELEIEGVANLLPRYISYTHVSTYESCPKKYNYRYIFNVPTPPASSLTFGSTIHATLRDLYERLKHHHESLEGFSEIPTLDDLLDIYSQRWISAGYDNKRHEQLRREYGRKKLKEYYETFFDPDTNVIGVETEFRYPLGKAIVKGYIDRIDAVGTDEETGKTVVEIIDYKTGSVKKESDVKKDLQLSLYAMVAEESFGYKVERASLIFVEHGVRMSIEIDEKLRDAVNGSVAGFVEGVGAHDFTANPSFLCKFCDYRDICSDALLL